MASSGSIWVHGLRLAVAVSLLLSIGISSAGAVDEARDDVVPGGLYRIEDGVLVIDWSPEVGFSSDFAVAEGDNSRAAGAQSGINASLGSFLDENASLSPAAGGHLGWASWDPETGDHGRHQEYGRRVTDLMGVFSIEMEIKLGSNFSSSPGTAEWMTCI